MAFIKLYERVASYDAEGKPVMYVEGTHLDGDTLPTENIAQGSLSMDLTNKEMDTFDGTQWGTLFAFPST